MNKTVKKALLLLPPLRRYVQQVRETKGRLNELEQLIRESSSPALRNSLTQKLLAHPAITPLPRIELGSQPAIENPRRVEVAERLLAAYHKALDDEKRSPLKREGEDLWTGLIRNELPELMSIIETHDPKKLAHFLMNFGRSFVWFGGITTCMDGYSRNLDRQQVAVTYLDKMVCLGEALGLLRLENPESGPWGTNLQIDVNELIERIEHAIQASVAPPLGIIHTDGLTTRRGLFHYRHINGLYSATRIKELNDTSGPICEFGGGLGITAMYCRRMGVLDYTILDLPITCLLAGHYLLHAVGLDSVTLYGEQSRERSIKILPYWECLGLPSKNYSVTVNQDSLPEISDNLIKEYLAQIRRITIDYFLSINHECFYPRTVDKFVAQEVGYKKIYRFKCWVREGYVEELYHIERRGETTKKGA
jgi:hypothetical protein